MKFNLSLCLFTLIALSTAHAQDFPVRKSGLWETVIQGGSGSPPITSKQCVDSDLEKKLGYDWSQSSQAMGFTCEKPSISKAAAVVTSKTTCKTKDTTIKSTTTISGDMNSAYKMVVNSSMEPAPMPQMKNSTTTMTATYKGTCPADMAPGDATTELAGMKGQALPKMNMYKMLAQPPKK
jgi:hypothetical protein